MTTRKSLIAAMMVAVCIGGVMAGSGCGKKEPPKPPPGMPKNAAEFKKMQEEANAFLDKLQATPKEERPALLKSSKEDMRKIMMSPDPSLQMRLSRIMSGQADQENGETGETGETGENK